MTLGQLLRPSLILGLAVVPAGFALGQEGEHSSPDRLQVRRFRFERIDPQQKDELGESIRRQFERSFPMSPEGGLRFFGPGQMGQFRFELDGESVLGLTLRPAPEVLRSHLDLPEGGGLVVSNVAEDSPAKGTIEENDILLRVGETTLSEPSDLSEALEAAEGDTLAITLLRKGEERTVEVERPRADAPQGERYVIGVTIEAPDDAVRAQLGLPEGQGVIVMSVSPDSAAAEAGLKPNDILVTLGGEPIVGARELSEQVQENGAKPVELTIIRDGEETTVEVTPRKAPAPPVPPAPPGVPEGFRFFGPGVMIDPEGNVLRPGPGGAMQPRSFVFPGQVSPELERKLDDVLKQLDQLRQELEDLKQTRPDRRDRGRDGDRG
ncbi:PDZ domain-containing protein [Tautonia sociabilis]|uniref:PDZ domain-containing protein n=1 Tax=Tautonia sociabilis TaxID=2080755 RepID=A0A432MQP7_9BACT|nr:PDZ domain-containing protein [Tautonia sociabilis]RUL89376.1 PDZ domain-containing protein [Tautonia sociabilis]